MIEKIERFLNKQLPGVEDLLFLKSDTGYELFNKYFIQIDDRGYYIVTVKNKVGEHVFYNIQNAVTWCIYENRKKTKDVRRIEYLDNNLGSIEVSMGIHKRMLTSKSSADKSITLTKLNEETLKRKTMQKELNRYVSTSKHWQTKSFVEKQPKNS